MTNVSATLRRRRLLVTVAVFVLIIGSAAVPVRHTLRVPCSLEPAAIWQLKYDGSGQIAGIWQRALLNQNMRQMLYQIDRPDVAEFDFQTGIRDGATIQAGDTLGWIHSRDLSYSTQVREAELSKAHYFGEALRAGGRTEDQRVAAAELTAAETAVNAYRPEYDRMRELFEKHLISDSEFQLSKGTFDALIANRDVAQANVNALKAGARSEDLRVAEADIKRLESEVARANSLIGLGEAVTAPFDGIVQIGGAESVLLTLSRIDTLDARLLMPESYGSVLSVGQTTLVTLSGANRESRPAQIHRLEYLNADSTALAVHALLPNPGGSYLSGMGGVGEFETARLTLLQSLQVRMGGAGWSF